MACAQAAKRLVRKQRKIISDQEDWDREQEARQSAREARKDNDPGCFHYRPEQHITTKKLKFPAERLPDLWVVEPEGTVIKGTVIHRACLTKEAFFEFLEREVSFA